MTDVCSHQHPTQGKAQTCADRLTAIRNGTSSCPTCGVPQHLPCVNPDTGREVPDHADRPAPIPGYKR